MAARCNSIGAADHYKLPKGRGSLKKLIQEVMPSRSLADCEPVLAYAFKRAYDEWIEAYPHKPLPFITCTHRSHQEQAELYAKGRTAPGPKVTNAKPGQSKHNLYPSKAIDIAFKKVDGNLDWSIDNFKLFASLIKKHGVTWGGEWKFIDNPHFEI